ncbi:MAG: epsG [Rhodocyclales bacterium]|nr:epsG [Rhodocyclales bacterium]
MNAPLGNTSPFNERVFEPALVPRHDGKLIGTILTEDGRLSLEDADRVLRVAQENGLRFGEAAKRLNILSEDDIQFALARQFDYFRVTPGRSTLSGELIAAYDPDSAAAEGLRALRSQLMLRWFGASALHQTLAVVSADRGEGRSWTAANLAIVFSQLGERTLLIDADLRNPRQHSMFGIDNSVGLSTLLTGRRAESCIQRIPQLRDLSILPAGMLPPNPQELLSRPFFDMFLSEIRKQYDVILLDTPAAAVNADAQTIAARAGSAVLITQKDISRSTRIKRVLNDIRETGAQVVGSVISKH